MRSLKCVLAPNISQETLHCCLSSDEQMGRDHGETGRGGRWLKPPHEPTSQHAEPTARPLPVEKREGWVGFDASQISVAPCSRQEPINWFTKEQKV